MVLDSQGFDLWAGAYDESIGENEENYPFAGYYRVLSFSQGLIAIKNKPSVLDLGVGTGLFTKELYDKGCRVLAVDFSKKMLQEAKGKMPQAAFYLHDLAWGLPPQLQSQQFNYIVATYALHHLPVKKQLALLFSLARHNLKRGGQLIIADIAFQKRADWRHCRQQAGPHWDDGEHYLILEEIKPFLKKAGLRFKYTQVTHCAGVLEVSG